MPASQTPAAFIIDVAKIGNYLLNLDHPVGRSKAAFFLGCGFVAVRPDELADCLFAHAAIENLVDRVQSSFGTKWIFEGAIMAPAGVFAGIRSVWMSRSISPVAALITAFKS